MKSIVLRSPAKLNLVLKVLGPRPDGYHELSTLFERIDLADEIRLDTRDDGRVRVVCAHPDVPRGPRNLAVRAAALLREDFNIKKGVDIHIHKRIPVAAGLAGGSSNAAAVLKGLNQLWNLKLPPKTLVGCANRLGSDVAFFMHECSWAWGTGRGEQIKKLLILKKLWHVLVVPRVKVYTRQVFHQYRQEHPNLGLTKKGDDVSIWLPILRKMDARAVSGKLSNDLEEAIVTVRPQLRRSKSVIEKIMGEKVVFSGSGPSMFAVVDSRPRALAIGRKLKKRYQQVFVVQTI